MQAGRLDEPYTTYVVQLEGTLLRKELDRQAGFKHMIRPHAEDALRLVAKEGKGKAHVWFWGSESQAQASVMTESLFLGSEVSLGGAANVRTACLWMQAITTQCALERTLRTECAIRRGLA